MFQNRHLELCFTLGRSWKDPIEMVAGKSVLFLQKATLWKVSSLPLSWPQPFELTRFHDFERTLSAVPVLGKLRHEHHQTPDSWNVMDAGAVNVLVEEFEHRFLLLSQEWLNFKAKFGGWKGLKDLEFSTAGTTWYYHLWDLRFQLYHPKLVANPLSARQNLRHFGTVTPGHWYLIPSWNSQER